MNVSSANLDNYPVQKWATKGSMPKHLQREAKRIDFRFERVWVAIDHNSEILLTDGRRMKTVCLCLKSAGWVIGTSDLQAGVGRPWAFEWQVACADHHLDTASLYAQLGGKH